MRGGTIMANFVLLFSGGNTPASEAEQAAVIQVWVAWYGHLGSATVDAGNPFTPIAKSIASNGTVSDGPVGTMASGYTIVSADSLDAAVELAKSCPVLHAGGAVSVYETFRAPSHDVRTG
jgi:hypothetical protein